MSNLLEQASLVLIPSGYEEDVVYSEIPLDGSGDMTFVRPGDGTRINSAGLVENCPWNLAQNSETFNSSPWTTSLSTISTNATTAPNGTTTAEKLVEDTNAGLHQVYQEIIASGSIVDQFYTFSCYAKASERSKITFILQTPSVSEATFDLINGTASITGGSGTAGVAIENVGNGWYRCSIYRLNTSAGYIYGNIVLNNGSGTSYTGNGTSGLFIYGAQLNIGSTAKPYFPTTNRQDVPRLTYQNGGGGCPSLLLEKQSTNVSYQSSVSSFGSGANDWFNGANSPCSINQTIGVDGTQNGAKYTKTAGATTDDFLYKVQVSVTSGTTYTVSGYIKLGTASNAVIVINNSQNWNTISNGSIVCSTANGFSTTAWKRFELTITAPSSNKINVHYGYHEETGVAQQETGTFFFDGLQVEASSYATSLIPTQGSSVTRLADACYKTGISSLIGQTEGVMFVDYNYEAKPDVNGNIPMVIVNGSNEAYIFITGGGTLLCELYNGGVVQGSISGSAGSAGRKKIAFAYKQNDFAVYLNGSLIGTDNAGTVGSMSNLYVGSYYVANYSANSGINQAILFPTRLTNSQLASLTTL